ETMWRVLAITLGVGLGAALVTHTVLAQDPPLPHPPLHGGEMPMPHGAMHGTQPMPHRPDATGAPAMPGQDAFGAIAEVVQMLDADPTTDWSKVDLERLRQHRSDMNAGVRRAQVKPTAVPGRHASGATGSGRTARAI